MRWIAILVLVFAVSVAVGKAGTVAFEQPVISAVPLPRTELLNISTRAKVESGDRLAIGGFIINGTDPKRVVIRALGPSLEAAGISHPLSDPMLELRDAAGNLIARNFDWRDDQEAEIDAINLAPKDDREAALVETLNPVAYTASMTAQDSGTGIGLVEVYDIDSGSSAHLANLSTRGRVGIDDEIMIGGIILGGTEGSVSVVVRGLGPSLAQQGISDPLADPTLEIRDSNGALIATNDNWRDTQQQEISDSMLAPNNELESAVIVGPAPGAYTAILRGKNGSVGIGLIEFYRLE